MTTDVAVRSAAVPAGEWNLIAAQAERLATSDIIPGAYRRKPANIIVAALTGRAHGWDVLTAMRNGHVIEGTWGMKPEAMLGLIRAHGHSVTGATTPQGAKVHGKRSDTGDEMDVEFTLDDASRAGLAGKGTWKQYPQMMCYWRAVGLLGRMLFSDVTLGVYSSEELGVETSADGDVIETTMAPAGPVPLSAENVARFRVACESEGLDPDGVLDEAFGIGVRPDPLTDVHLPKMRDAFARMVRPAEEASVESAAPPEPAPAGSVSQTTDPAGDSGEGPKMASHRQVGAVKGHYERLGAKDRLLQLSYTSQFLGRPLASHNDLTDDQARKLLDILATTEELP